MEWYVYWHDSNARKIIKWNIFEHGTFRKELDEMYKKYDNKEDFAERLNSVMLFYFWSKCEHEVLFVNPWVGDGDSMKIDVYDQLHMNWDAFVDYLWSFKEDQKLNMLKRCFPQLFCKHDYQYYFGNYRIEIEYGKRVIYKDKHYRCVKCGKLKTITEE